MPLPIEVTVDLIEIKTLRRYPTFLRNIKAQYFWVYFIF